MKAQGLLDDDDSSDASPQLAESSPKKEIQLETKRGGGLLKKRRLQREDSDSSSGEEATSGPEASQKGSGEDHRLAHRGSAWDEQSRSSKALKTPADEAKFKAAAFRKQRMRKLYALRVSTGEHGRMAAFKLKRQQSGEVRKIKERKRIHAHRAARKARKMSAGAEANVQNEGELRLRSSRLESADNDATDKLPAIRATKTKDKILAVTASTSGSTTADVKAEREDSQVEPLASTTNKVVEEVNQEGEDQMCGTSSPVPVSGGHNRQRSAETTKHTATASVKSGGALYTSFSDPGESGNGEVGQVSTPEGTNSKEAKADSAINMKAIAVSSRSIQPAKLELNDKEQPAVATDGFKASEDNYFFPRVKRSKWRMKMSTQ